MKIIHFFQLKLLQLLVCLIIAYRNFIRPYIGHCCRFYPGCSEYALLSLQQYGLHRGLTLAIRRILRCHPFHPGGCDPVPSVKEEKINVY